MRNLTQNDLKKMMLLSYERIEKEKEEINKINIFPVPDQDTGDNVAKTLLGIKEAIEKKDFETFSDLSEAILDGALTNAQGNAGVIYTGFLAGFLPKLTETIDVKNLAIGFKKGLERAKESIQNPKEGTILDVIDAVAETFQKESINEKNIIYVFEKAVKNADDALLLTKEKMEIFKKANVVDAGGMAFLIIIESYLEALKGKGGKIRKQERHSEKVKRFIQIISNRYEIVALIINPVFEKKEMKEKLQKLGNSIDIVQVKNKVKVHIHSAHPDEVKAVLKKSGEIKRLRIEDVVKEVVGEKSIKAVSVGIVTESSSMILSKIIERYQIQLIDCEKNWPAKKRLKQNIFQKLREGRKIKTKLSPRAYLDAFAKQIKKFDNVLCITSSSKLYNYYDLAKKARLMSSNPEKVFIFDSLNTGTGQALTVLKAIELIQEQNEIREVIKELQMFIPKIHSNIVFGNSQKQRKSDKIQLHLLVKIKNGRVLKTGIVLTQDIAEALTKRILKQSKKFKKIRLVIGYTQNIKIAKKLKKNLKSKIGVEIPFINLIPFSVDSIIGAKSVMTSWTGIKN